MSGLPKIFLGSSIATTSPASSTMTLSAHLCDTLHLMVYHDNRDSVLIQILYNIKNLFTSQRIKLCRTFVQYENLGLHDKGGTESYSLYLTTPDSLGIFVNDVTDSHQFGYGIHLFLIISSLGIPRLPRPYASSSATVPAV